jgi:hypothetical protein
MERLCDRAVIRETGARVSTEYKVNVKGGNQLASVKLLAILVNVLACQCQRRSNCPARYNGCAHLNGEAVLEDDVGLVGHSEGRALSWYVWVRDRELDVSQSM